MSAPYGYCQCGCGQKTRLVGQTDTRAGRVKGEPRQYVFGHNRHTQDPVYVVDERGCWIWQRAKDRRGYGSVRRRGGPNLAHALFWEQVNGPVPDGLELDHLCSTPSCVNPDHLEPVTHTENLRRGLGTQLTVEAVQEIRASGETHAALALRYGVSKGTIGNVRSRQSWKDVA